MDNTNKINSRLEKLREFVDILRTLKGVTTKDLKEDVNKRAKAERFLQLAIEACVDIAELIIVDQRLPAPVDSADAIEILGQQKIIDHAFAKDFAKSVGLRNILVHDYISVDYEIIADIINNRLSDFDRFAQEVAKFSTA